MISLVVTVDADTKNYNLLERDASFANLMKRFGEPYEIIYTTCSNFGLISELKRIVSEQKDRHLIVSAPSTNINTQIYTAFDYSNNGDVLLCTMDTNVEVLEEMLQKHFDGADLVYVKQEESFFKSIFTALGRFGYQIGLRILGRGQDLCCDARVLYLNARSVNTIIVNPALSKALRLTNPDPDKVLRTVSHKKIYDNPTSEQQKVNKSFMFLGFATAFYILALFAMAIIFPLVNDGRYTGYVMLALAAWIIVGFIACAITARSIYKIRLGYPVAVNLKGLPILNIEEYIDYNSALASKFGEVEIDYLDDYQLEERKNSISAKEKLQQVVSEKNSQQNAVATNDDNQAISDLTEQPEIAKIKSSKQSKIKK